jgi:hypothetical protein
MLVAAWAVAFLAAGPAAADPVTLDGITFSDERGGLVIRGGSGRGTLEDPFVLREEITDDGPAVLVIRGLDRHVGGEGPDSRPVGWFALVKVVTNATGRPWASFELELREDLARPSTYDDGLSFAQGLADLDSRFVADRFRRVRRVDEPLDAVEFSDGLVRPGEAVRVTVVVTDYTPIPEFYLLQRREGQVADLPPFRPPRG